MGFVALTGALPDSWLFVSKGNHLAYRYLRFIPLKYQRAVWPQDSESLAKTCPDIVTPCFFVQSPVFFSHPTVFTGSVKVRWIKNYLRKMIVRKR